MEYEIGVQKPRIPIWIGGLRSNKGPFLRAAKWDGMMSHTIRSVTPGERLELDEIEKIMDLISSRRQTNNFDLLMLSYQPREKDQAKLLLKEYFERGVTWWVESVM